MPSPNGKHKVSCNTPRPSDRVVLEYLDALVQRGEGETCTASIPQISVACDISTRQVQISTRRLIDAGLLLRVGYDFSNPDRTKRGTIYKVLVKSSRARQKMGGVEKKKSIKFLLYWSQD